MLMPDAYTDCSYSPTTDEFEDVNDLSYYGPFYTITCDLDKHNWIITVDPWTATPGELSYREVWVFMWDGSDNFNFVFQFEQNDDDSFEGIEQARRSMAQTTGGCYVIMMSALGR